jgi:flagellar hook-associated protein 1 FlgK
VLSSISALDPQAAGSVSDALAGFWSSMRALSQSPADTGLRAQVVAATHALGMAFQRTRAALESARTGVDARLAASTSEANSLAAQVASLNGQIRSARASGTEPNDLLDSRQKAVDRLAELTGVSPVNTSEGDVSLFLPGGAGLVNGLIPGTLGTLANAANDGHLDLTLSGPGGSAQAFTGMGGELGGLLDARDGALKASVSGLDQLAWGLAGAVNNLHRAGRGLNGTLNYDLFTTGPLTSGVNGAAGRLDVSALVAADPSLIAAATTTAGLGGSPTGDATNLKALLALENAAVSGGLSAGNALAKLTSDLGVAASTADLASQQDTALRDNLQTMRESASGVSIDEEMIELQKAQRAYEAIAKVIATSNTLFDTLLQLK